MTSSAITKVLLLKEKAFTAVRNHKRLKTSHNIDTESAISSINLYDEFIATNVIRLKKDEEFNVINY